MKAKMKVTFEPSVISASEVERRLKFIENLPIKAMSHNFQDISDLEMEVFFGKDNVTRIHPENADKIYYTNLEKVEGCEIYSNTSCTSIINVPTGKPSEAYGFFYEKSK